ncbi:hypothetical protein [Staphylococcus epidermidis]|uniref:hypothetical protein n=1 Tax=Staphylococcus epidermidis TaxID=1282 RepID=UPI00164301C8
MQSNVAGDYGGKLGGNLVNLEQEIEIFRRKDVFKEEVLENDRISDIRGDKE